MPNSELNVEVPIAIGSDATKMLRELKLVTKDCFVPLIGRDLQDDSSNAAWSIKKSLIIFEDAALSVIMELQNYI